MEIREKLIPIGVSMSCDNCLAGYLEVVDVNSVKPDDDQILHRCTNCGFQQFFEKIYPSIEYDDEDF